MSTKSRVNKRKRSKPLVSEPPLPKLDPPSKKRKITTNNVNLNKNSKKATSQHQQEIDRKNNENSGSQASSPNGIPSTSNSNPTRSSLKEENEQSSNYNGHGLGALMSGRKPGLFLRRDEVMNQLQEMAKSGAIPEDLQKQMDQYKARMNAKRNQNKNDNLGPSNVMNNKHTNTNNARLSSDNSQQSREINRDIARMNGRNGQQHQNQNDNHDRDHDVANRNVINGSGHRNENRSVNNTASPNNISRREEKRHRSEKNKRPGEQHANHSHHGRHNINHNQDRHRNRNNRNRNNRHNRNRNRARLPQVYQAIPRPICQRIVVTNISSNDFKDDEFESYEQDEESWNCNVLQCICGILIIIVFIYGLNNMYQRRMKSVVYCDTDIEPTSNAKETGYSKCVQCPNGAECQYGVGRCDEEGFGFHPIEGCIPKQDLDKRKRADILQEILAEKLRHERRRYILSNNDNSIKWKYKESELSKFEEYKFSNLKMNETEMEESLEILFQDIVRRKSEGIVPDALDQEFYAILPKWEVEATPYSLSKLFVWFKYVNYLITWFCNTYWIQLCITIVVGAVGLLICRR